MAIVCDLNYKKYGHKGDAIVILHGLFGMLDNWNSFAKQLASEYQVFILDQRNHGRSCHSDEMSYDLMAADLVFFLESHGLSRVHLVGHSMGGKIAMNFALIHPERVTSLVVLDIAPKAYRPVHLPIFKVLKSIDLRKEWTRAEISSKLAQKIPFPAVVQFLMKNLARESQARFRWKMNLDVIYDSYEALSDWSLPDLQNVGKVLFVKGASSDYILNSDRPSIQTYFPEAQIELLEGAGHWIHADQPDGLMRIFYNFFGQVEI